MHHFEKETIQNFSPQRGLAKMFGGSSRKCFPGLRCGNDWKCKYGFPGVENASTNLSKCAMADSFSWM